MQYTGTKEAGPPILEKIKMTKCTECRMKNYLLYFCMKSHPNKIYYENIFLTKAKRESKQRTKLGTS
jgi:hypothetical protein